MTPPPPAFERIERALRLTRRRLRLRAGVSALGWLLAAGGVALAIAVLVGAAGASSVWARGALVALGLIGIGAVAARVLWPLRGTGRDAAVAAHLEDQLGTLHDGLLASVQFRAAWPDVPAGSPALVEGLAHQMAARLDGADLGALTPLRPARRGWIAAGGVAVAWAILLLAAPRWVDAGLAALSPPPLNALGERQTGPLVGDLIVTLHFPDHVKRKPRTIPNSTGDIEAPKGTRVEISATTLAPARGAALRFGEGQAELPLALSEGRDLRGEFVIDAAGTWRFALVSAEGETLVEGLDRRLRVEPDRPPTVTLQLPAEDVTLEDLRGVPVAYEARDDFGLSKSAIIISLAEHPEHPEEIVQPGVEGARYDGADEVDLTVIQAQPGDRLALTAVAWDNNGVDGPQKGASVTRYITVNSPHQKHYALAEKLQASIEKLLTALADRLELEWKGERLAARLSEIAGTTRGAAEALGEVVEAMAEDPLTPEEVRLALAGRLGALEKAMAAEQRFADDAAPSLDALDAPTLRIGQRHNDEVIEELEQAIVLVEAMVARLALEDMAALAEELRASKERLRDLIEAYRKNPNDALKARIMRDIQRLRDRMREMQARMAKIRQKLPEEFLNLDGLKKDDVAKGLDKSKDQLAELEKMLEEGKVDEALSALDEMSKALDELSASLDQDMQDLHAETNPEMQKAISELMDQTRDLMKRQEEAAKATDAAAAKQAEAQRKALEEQLGQKLAEAKDKARKLRESVEQLATERMPSIAEEEMGHLGQRTQELEGALERNQIVEALEMADRSMDHLDAMERFNRYDPQGDRYRDLVQKSRKLDQALMKDLAELLDSARQQSAQALSPGEAEALRQQQQGLAEAAKRLQQRIEQRGEKMPGLQGEPMQRIQQAEDAMRRSADQLGQQQPGQARPGQQEAMSELQALMEGLKQANKPQRADRQQGKSRQTSREKVRIPGAEEYEAPAEFRKELLDAMKQRPTDAYREQVKRYYESLIR